MNSNERRENLLHILKTSNKPVKGGDLAKELNVTRQVVVKDIGLLRASGIDILATSTGYMIYDLKDQEFQIKCKNHNSNEELYDELKTISIIKPKIPSYISKLNVRNNVSPKNLSPNWSRPIDDQIKCLEKLDVKDLKKWKESLYTNEGLYDPAPMLAFYQIFENKK